jgi:hypothetical protein
MEIILIAIIVFLALALIWAYRKGLKDGLKIGSTKEVRPEAVERVLDPVKPKPVPPEVLKEQKRLATIMQNVANTGTSRRQIDVE